MCALLALQGKRVLEQVWSCTCVSGVPEVTLKDSGITPTCLDFLLTRLLHCLLSPSLKGPLASHPSWGGAAASTATPLASPGLLWWGEADFTRF